MKCYTPLFRICYCSLELNTTTFSVHIKRKRKCTAEKEICQYHQLLLDIMTSERSGQDVSALQSGVKWFEF